MIKLFEQFNIPEKRERYYDNGQKYIEIWSLNGEYHREDGPATQWWFKNGQKEYESWYINNKYHREDGPAFQRWYSDGQKLKEVWYLNDINYTREDWVNQLKKIGSPHYEEQKMLLNMEKYNI